MNSDKKQEFCYMEYHPCRKALKKQIYETAKQCKKISIKRCKEDPTKKRACETADEAISRLKKMELCSYIAGNPALKRQGQVNKNYFKDIELKKDLSKSFEDKIFSPQKIELDVPKVTYFGSVQSTLYLMKFSGKGSVLYRERTGSSKAFWINYDRENNDEKMFEDGWHFIFPDDFESYLRGARRRGIHHIFLYLSLYKKIEDKEKISKHANFLLFDLDKSILYRYEPSGYADIYDIYDMNKLDKFLSNFARSKRMSYIPPWDSCPSQLFAKVAAAQRMAGKAKLEEGDPGGFCKVWATFMLEQKLKHPEMDMDDIQRNLVQLFLENKVDMINFARRYIQRINQYGNKILKDHGMKEGDDPDEFLEKKWRKLFLPIQTKQTKKNKHQNNQTRKNKQT